MLKHSYLRPALVLTASLGILGESVAVQAQSTTGAIGGTISPSSHVSIEVNNDSGLSRRVSLDTHGHYLAAQLPLGTYTVIIRRDSKVIASIAHIQLKLGHTTEASWTQPQSKQLNAVHVMANRSPAIDVGSVDSRTVIDAQQLQRLPLGRSAEAIALLAPGVMPNSGGYTGPTGQSLLSFGGSSASENAYYINGFNTTDPLRGFGGITLPYNSIDQEEIYTGGYSAQYGRSDGGVINLVGKRGSNQWHYGGQLVWEPDALRSPQENIYYVNGLPSSPIAGRLYAPKSANKQASTIYDGYLSGPLIKDRLFFFVSGEFARQNQVTTNSVTASNPYVHSRNELPKLYAKLDWNINKNNILEISGASSRSYSDGSIHAYDYANHRAGNYINSADQTKTGGRLWTAKFTSYITANLTFTALYGKMKTFNYDVPGNYNGALTYLADTSNQNPALNGGIPISNTQTVSSLFNANRHNQTNNLRLALNYQLGSHSLSIGIDNLNSSAIDQGSQASGPGYTWDYGYSQTPQLALIPSLGVGAPADYANGASGYYAIQKVNSSLASVRTAQRAQYIEDQWQASDRLLISLGLRNDQFSNYNAHSQPYIQQRKPQWAPRIGFSWDVNGDASFKLYANAGRYYLGLPLNPALNAAGAYVSTSQYYTYSGIAADGTPTGLTAFSRPVSPNNTYGVLPDPRTVTANQLKSEYQDEFIIGFSRTLDQQWVYGAKTTLRILRNAIDDYCDVPTIEQKAAALGYTVQATNSCYLINPGRANSFTVIDSHGSYQTVPLTNAEMDFPSLKRKYYALETFFEHPFDGHWYGRLDYVYSRSYGDTEGQLRSDIQQTAASTSIDWDFPSLMSYSHGDQSNDHRHQIKLFGYYQINPQWLISGDVMIASGTPRNCLGYYGPNQTDPDGYGSSYHWCGGLPSPPGSQHLPWNKQVDLGLSYHPAWAGTKLGLSLNVFNLFNSQAPLNAYPYYQLSPHTPDPLYGAALIRQLPRYVRFSMNYDY